MTSPQEPDPRPAAGEPPYPYPGWAGYPPPYPGVPPTGYPPPPYPRLPAPRTSGWAVAAFVLGLFSCVPLGVIFGLIALVKTKDGRQQGQGLAIAGLVISALWVVGFFAAFAVFRFAESVMYGGRFKVGDCIAELSDFGRTSWDVVGCDQPHSGEVFAVFFMRDSDASTAEQNENRCRAELSTYAPSASRDPAVRVLVNYPSSVDWRSDDHTRLCIATFTSKRTGSIKTNP